MPGVLITPGDPDGVGPEVTARALAELGCEARIYGDRAAIEPWLARCGVDLPVIEPPGTGPIEVRAIEAAVERCKAHGDALVTGPIHKRKLADHGFAYAGHTDFLGALCGVERPVMAFVGGSRRVVLVTVHVPLSGVRITHENVVHTVRIAHQALRDQLGIDRPRLVVCGLNPHAGDGGLLGREELEVITPAVAALQDEGILAEGPVSAEHAFLPGKGGDMIVAMYHDQGLVPLKALDFGRTVNWTLGLPIVRTSVDHGTAYDLVGTDQVRPDSMIEAIRWARRLTSPA